MGGKPPAPIGLVNSPQKGRRTMTDFGPAAIVGLCIGFLWGIGCSLAILYSVFLGGYRKAVEDSLAPVKSKRWRDTLRKIEAREARIGATAKK
jgi:hypothetical protein